MSSETLLSYLSSFLSFSRRPALFFKTGFRTFSTTYEELYNFAYGAALYFEKQGLKKGERVILWGINSPEWVGAYLGLLVRGLIAVPLDIRGGAGFVKKISDFTGASLILSGAPQLAEFRGARVMSFEGLRKTAESASWTTYRGEEIKPQDTAEILFTSGTTAEPKGVVLTHENIYSNVESIDAALLGLSDNEKFLSILPLSHIFEQTVGLWVPLKRGYSITYLKVLKASSIFETLEEDGITFLPIVPRLLKLMQSGILREVKRQAKEGIFNWLLNFAPRLNVKHRRFLFPALRRKLGKLKHFIVGGATLERELERFWLQVGAPLLQGYGLTETSPVIACNFPLCYRFGSIGKVVPGVEVDLSPEKEILVRGKSVFSGYYRNPERTREVFEGEWFKTGDIGDFDSEGFLYFRGRKKDLIVTAEGLNVYPDDLESALHSVKGVKEACVVGFKKGDKELIHAAILLEDPKCDVKAVVDEANARLADYQKIQSFNVWPEEDFPRTSTMKVKKAEVLRALERELKSAEKETETKPKTPLLYQFLAQLAKVKPEEIRAEMRLGDDLGLTSLDRVELAAMIEEAFHFDVDDAFFLFDTRVKEIEALIKAKILPGKEEGIPRWPARPWACQLRKPFQALITLPITKYFCRLKVEGLENVETVAGPVIFIANHTSYFDAPAIFAALPRDIRLQTAVATWREFFETRSPNPLVKLWKRFMFCFAALGFNIYPFPQQKGFKRSMEHTGWLMDRNFNVLFFPEGMRTRTGKLQEFKEGIGKIVSEMKTPVIPVGIKGLFEIYPLQKNFPQAGEVTIRFGEPLPFEKFENQHQSAIAQGLAEEVRKLLD